MELFKIAAKIDIVHIPYKGAAPSRIDFLGGHVHTMFDVLRTALPYHQAGKSRILAIASLQRSALAPELPTIDESGYKDIEVKGWHGLLGPAGMPSALANQIQGEVARGLLDPAMKEKLFKSGIDVAATTPAETDAFMRADVVRWSRVVQVARIRAD
jgi:tripartite-type tricarboxylate transporter receptor subunit TctC